MYGPLLGLRTNNLGFDYYGFKQGFAPERPWLFQDFDILTFNQVTEDELNEKLELFRSGQYEFEWETAEFDMEQHNRLLVETADEVKQVRVAQRKVQDEMIEAENQSLAKWRADKAKNKPDESTIDSLLQDPAITAIEAPVDANVWKIEVKEKDEIKAGQVIAILEGRFNQSRRRLNMRTNAAIAMKLEINVNAPDDTKSGKAVIEKLLVEPVRTPVQALLCDIKLTSNRARQSGYGISSDLHDGTLTTLIGRWKNCTGSYPMKHGH